MSPDPDNLRSRQRVWPLVAVALTLTLVGFFLAFRAPDGGADKHAPPSSVEFPDEQADAAKDPDRPINLTYGGGAKTETVETKKRAISLTLHQTRRTGHGDETAVVNSSISLDADEVLRLRGDDKPGMELERTFHSARVSVSDEQSGESAPEISRQVARMLNGSVERIRMTPAGERDDLDWTSVTNPQVRRTLGLVRAADALLMPRFRGEGVNAGEEWTYRLPAPPERKYREQHPQLAFDGAVTVSSRFAGVVERDDNRLAVLVRRVEFQATGKSGDSRHAPTFSLSGSGRGEALFDIDAGQVVDSWLRITRDSSITSERGEGGGDAVVKLRLVADPD